PLGRAAPTPVARVRAAPSVRPAARPPARVLHRVLAASVTKSPIPTRAFSRQYQPPENRDPLAGPRHLAGVILFLAGAPSARSCSPPPPDSPLLPRAPDSSAQPTPSPRSR